LVATLKVRRGGGGGHKQTTPENGSAVGGKTAASRRASSDSARDRRNTVSRQGSRADYTDSDGLSPSMVGASLLPDDRQDDKQSPDDEAQPETGAAANSTARCSKRTGAGDDTTADVYKVLVLGSQGVGKTTLVEQLMTSEYLANKDNSFPGKCLRSV